MRRVTNALNCTSTARSCGNASRKRANKLPEQKRDSLSSISVLRLTRCVCTVAMNCIEIQTFYFIEFMLKLLFVIGKIFRLD